MFNICEPTVLPSSAGNQNVLSADFVVVGAGIHNGSVNMCYHLTSNHPDIDIADSSRDTVYSADTNLVYNEQNNINIKSVKGIKVLHINIQSLLPKMDEFRKVVSEYSFDIISVNETWLVKDINDYEVALDGFDIFRRDRNS